MALTDRERTPGTWMSHHDANESVMMQVPGAGPFVRCLLPIALTGGYSVTFGVWLAVAPEDLQRAFRLWWDPAYRHLELDGLLANSLPCWGLLGSPSHAEVQTEDQTPCITSSTSTELMAVLESEWSHELVLGALPD